MYKALLDHGFVRLVDSMGSDLSIVRAARVSYDADWRVADALTKGDKHLINFLWQHAHTTPFEAVTLTFEVKAPIFVFRQWHRHRTWSYNELSARYRELPEEFYIPAPEAIGKQATVNKQGRALVAELTPQERGNLEFQQNIARHAMQKSFEAYRVLLADGWPRELARSVLPLSTYSHMFGTVNLLNLFRFLTLRADEHAQYEIRVYADAMIEMARSVAPVAVAAWEVKNWENKTTRQ